MTTTAMSGWTIAYVCPACLRDEFPHAERPDPADLHWGMAPVIVGLDCVDDLLFLGFELIPTAEDEDVYYLLCPHERETSRPHRPAGCCQLVDGTNCWNCAGGGG